MWNPRIDSGSLTKYLRPGRYHTGSLQGAPTTMSLVAGKGFAIPFVSPGNITVTKMAVYQTVVGPRAGYPFIMGIYSDAYGYPYQLVGGGFVTAGTPVPALKEATVNIPLEANKLYWLYLQQVETPTVSAIVISISSLPFSLLGYSTTLATVYGGYVYWTYLFTDTGSGSLPDTFPIGATAEYAGPIPKIGVKWNVNVPVTMDISPVNAGTVELVPVGGIYPIESSITLTAIPEEGYIFDHWEGDIWESQSVTNPVTIKVQRNQAIMACFVEG